jgi:hypothetical protein
MNIVADFLLFAMKKTPDRQMRSGIGQAGAG